MSDVDAPSNSTSGSTGTFQETSHVSPTESRNPSVSFCPSSKSGWTITTFLTGSISRLTAAARLFLNKRATPCYSSSHGPESRQPDVPVGEETSRRGVCDLQEEQTLDGGRAGALANSQQDRLHVQGRGSRSNLARSRQKKSNPVQTFLDVGVQLTRTVHWRWNNDSDDGVVTKGTRFSVAIDPELIRWLDQRGIKYKKTRAKIVSPKLGRPCWEVIFQFADIKEARYFSAVWQTKIIGAEELRSLLSAGRTKTTRSAG